MPVNEIAIEKVLETKRLILREFTVDDAPALYRYYSDPEIMRFMGRGKPVESVEKVRAWIEKHSESHYQEKRLGLWAVILKDNKAKLGPGKDTLIGHCGILIWEIDEQTEYEVAYMLAMEYRGQGYATEAAIAVRDLGFNQRGFDRMISLIYPENEESQKVAIRNGMVHEKDTVVMDDVTLRVYVVEKGVK